jgi:hypothetical protein
MDWAPAASRALRTRPPYAPAFRNLLGGHIDCDDFTIWRSQWMPIRHPGALLDLICTLSRDFDADDRLSSFDDRTHDLLDGIRQCGHAVSDKTPEMILNRNAANLGKALVDL